MESRFGRDFGGVRVHTDRHAEQAAAQLGADAFTVGSDVAFAAGSYSPATAAGKQLLAHELTHVAQQGGAPTVAAPGVGPGAATVAQTAAQPMVSMRGPVARVPVRPVPLRRPPVRAGTGAASGPRTAESAPYHQRYAPPEQYDTSLHAIMWRSSVARTREQAIFEAEVPTVSLQRGGAPPNFVTQSSTPQSMIGEGWHATYYPRSFHILDAIEHRVSRATRPEQLESVILDYMGDTWFARQVIAGAAARSLRQPRAFAPTYLPSSLWMHRWPRGLDPQGEQRLRVYAVAVAAQVAAAPQLQSSPLAAPFADILMVERVRRRQGPCETKQVPRSGGHPGHDAYATKVTGSRHDFRVVTPEGIACNTDGLDPHGQTWEVKTGYRYFSEWGLVWSLEVPRFEALVGVLEEQRARCLYVTARCGYAYAYAFDNEEVAEFFRDMWSIPPVFYIEP